MIGTTAGTFPAIGTKVRSAYHGGTYEVLDYSPAGNDSQPFGWESITVRWDDGQIVTHSTPLGKRDVILQA
jgi:hypothetical protein